MDKASPKKGRAAIDTPVKKKDDESPKKGPAETGTPVKKKVDCL